MVVLSWLRGSYELGLVVGYLISCVYWWLWAISRVFCKYLGRDLLFGEWFFVEICLIIGSDLVSSGRDLLVLLYLEKKTNR